MHLSFTEQQAVLARSATTASGGMALPKRVEAVEAGAVRYDAEPWSAPAAAVPAILPLAHVHAESVPGT